MRVWCELDTPAAALDVASVSSKCSPCLSFFFSSRRRHTRFDCDWSSDVCSSDLADGDGRCLDIKPDQPEAAAAGPHTSAHSETGLTVFKTAGHRRVAGIRKTALLASILDAFFGGKPGRIETRNEVRAIRKSAPQIAKRPDAGIAPRGRHDDGIHKRALHAMKRRRLVPFVDDAHRNEHHAGAQVESPVHHEVDVGLFNRDLATLFGAFDEGVLDLHFRPELQSIAEGVADHQHEPMEIGLSGQVLLFVEMDFHVARERRHTLARSRRRPGLRRGRPTNCQESHGNRRLPASKNTQFVHRNLNFDESKYSNESTESSAGGYGASSYCGGTTRAPVMKRR